MYKTFKTLKHHGYSVAFSTVHPNIIACAASQNYGLAGPGALFVFDQNTSQSNNFAWEDGLFDLSWSENNPNILATGSGDGSIQIWGLNEKQGLLTVLRKHIKEVNCVDWNRCGNQHLLLSGSWDGTMLMWDPEQSSCINEYLGNQRFYDVSWSPDMPSVFASVSGDGSLSIWDFAKPTQLAMTIQAHTGEALSCSWNYFKQGIIVTSSVDGLIKGWDIRIPNCPVFQLIGHEYAVRRVKCSPHKESVLASCSYDYNTIIWDWDCPTPRHILRNHTEFAYGLDFNRNIPGQVADCGWDEAVKIFQLP